MKKFTTMIAVALFSVALIGCPGETPPAKPDPTPPPVVVEATPIPPVVIVPPVIPPTVPPVVVPPTVPPVVVNPTAVPPVVPPATWWPPRPSGVPANFVYCPLPSPSGGDDSNDWRLRSSCPYDPYVRL